jgi:hypothetical protein
MISPERLTPIAANWKCIIICLFVSMANCQYGFDTNALAGFQAMIGFLKVFGQRDPKSGEKSAGQHWKRTPCSSKFQ